MANFYSNLNLKRNQLQLPVIHPSGSIPTGANIKGQLYFHNSADNEQLYLCVADGTDDGSSWVPLYNSISALSNGGMVVNAVATQNLQDIALALTNLLAITDSGEALDGADVMAVHDVAGPNAPRKVTMTQLKAFTNSGITGNVAGNLGETLAVDSYTITTTNGTSLSMTAADDTNWGIMTDDHVLSIATNATNIATNTTNITSNDTDIATNATNIAANTTNITSNDTDIATNATNIAANTTNITSNDTDIATNATNIAANTTNITSNDTDIATNATNIAANTTNITSNDTDIATNATNIAANTTNITSNDTDIATNATNIAFKANKASPAFTGQSTHTDTSPSYKMVNTNDNATGGVLEFNKNPVTDLNSADGDVIGSIKFTGIDGADVARDYGLLKTTATVVTTTEEQSMMEFGVMGAGTFATGLSISGTDTAGVVNVTLGANAASTTTVVGNLTVSGTTTTVNTNTLDVADNEITLNSDWANNTTPTQPGGIKVYRGDVGVATYGAGEDEVSLGQHPARLFYYEPGDGSVGKWQMDQGNDTLVDIGSSADTMGSGFTVAATTNTAPTTITEGETLTLTAGAGISTTATSDGVITIANTEPNVVEANMGAGFTVSATTNTAPTTITVGETLNIAASTGISTTATSDGVITIANTEPNVVEANMGAGFTVSATTNTAPTTITVGETLNIAASTGISTTATSDGVITIANTEPNVVEANMGAGFTVSATTNTAPTTITVGETLNIAAGNGISTTATSDGVITIANTLPETGDTQLPAKVAIIVVASIDATLKTVNITHAMGAGDIMVQLYELNDAGGIISNLIFADVQRTDDNTIQVKFDKIPDNNVRAIMIAENGTDLVLDSGSYPS